MNNADELVEEVHKVFKTQQHQWRIDGKLMSPTKEDIKVLLEQMVKDVEHSMTTCQCGNICVINNNGIIDLYVKLGEVE